jgi:hypothetical protein
MAMVVWLTGARGKNQWRRVFHPPRLLKNEHLLKGMKSPKCYNGSEWEPRSNIGLNELV